MEVKTSTHHIRAPRSRTAKFDAQDLAFRKFRGRYNNILANKKLL